MNSGSANEIWITDDNGKMEHLFWKSLGGLGYWKLSGWCVK